MRGKVEHDAAPVEVSRTSTPPPSLYAHGFFSAEAKPARKAIFPALILPLVYNAILLWACLALFFGSLLQSNDLSKTKVTLLNFDDGFVGKAVVDGVNKSLEAPGQHLRWQIVANGAEGGRSSRELVLEEKTWAVLEGMYRMKWAIRKDSGEIAVD